MVCVRPVAGLIAAVSTALALLVSAMGLMVQPVSAGLVSGESIPETTVLQTNVDILPVWNTIGTLVNLNGNWTDGSARNAVISEGPSAIEVNMSAFNRPTAHGSVVDNTSITVTFPDDKTYTGQLQSPNKIIWSNGSVWTKIINTVMDLNGRWTDGSARSVYIAEGPSAIKVDMSEHDRPNAQGSIVNTSTISISFPDDKTYTGQLQPPNKIRWSNGSVWTKKPPLADDEIQGRLVLSVPVTLQAGQSRRISDQLTVTGQRDAEIDHLVMCMDPTQGYQSPANIPGRAQAHASGTNYSPGMGQLKMHGSLLFTAPFTGTFLCQIRAFTSAGNDHKFHMTAVAAQGTGGTWLEIDNFTDAPSMWWQNNTCQSNGRDPNHPNHDDPNCIFLGRPIGGGDHHPVTAVLYEHDHTWIAPSNATKVDVVSHMQITSCYFDTKSCPEHQQGPPDEVPYYNDRAMFRTHLDFIQLSERNAPCNVTSTPDTVYTISNDVHHFLVDYGPITVPVSQTCGGSRQFALHVVVAWADGNTVKIDEGSFPEFRSATNANVIVRSTRPITTVPPVIGVDQGEVAGHLAAWGLTMGTVTRVVNPTRPGIVIAQNSPEGTIEPIGSPVDLTISLGAVTVPDLNGDTTAQAVSKLSALGLVARIQQAAQCLDPGGVIDQIPSAGTIVAPGSTVTITIDTASPKKCQVK